MRYKKLTKKEILLILLNIVFATCAFSQTVKNIDSENFLIVIGDFSHVVVKDSVLNSQIDVIIFTENSSYKPNLEKLKTKANNIDVYKFNSDSKIKEVSINGEIIKLSSK